MPSSISSSNIVMAATENFDRPGFVRLTASDRPGVAQPVPVRDVPVQPWGRIFLIAVVLFIVLLSGWEYYWRDYGVVPAYANSNDSWAAQRRRIDQGEGNSTVLIGSSRVLFDLQLPVWESVTGKRPIQLALEGTSPVPILEDLADDPHFTGRLLIGVVPSIFFSGFAFRGNAIPYYHKQSLSQRSGHWLSQHFVEPYFAFFDGDYALNTVIKRQPWPARPGVPQRMSVRKLAVSEPDRNTHMWQKVETDPAYQTLARSIWAQNFTGPPPPNINTPEKLQKSIDTQIGRAVAAIAKLRARGVRLMFIRLPSSGDFYAFENKVFPRSQTWDVLLQRTGSTGIHFEDYAALQGYDLPEWSHLSASEAQRFTAVLAPLVEQEFNRQEQLAVRPSLNPQP